MSEFSSNPEAFNSREQFALLDLIEAVQKKVTDALAYEENLQHLSVEAGQAGGRTTNIARHDEIGNENVYGPHHQIVWMPEHGEDALFGILRVEIGISDESHNDFFLRVHDMNENQQNFLLNSRGLIPFNIVSTDIDKAELIDQAPKEFMVKEGIVCVPAVEIDVFTLDAIINADTYKFYEQPRTGGHKQQWGRAS